jgi:hypothetical protein
MRHGSVVFEGRTLMWVVAAVAAALFVLGPTATAAFGQATAVDAGDDIQYSAVCQNIIGSIGDITQTQDGDADAVAVDNSEAVAAVAQYSGVSIGQVNECLNGQAPLDQNPPGDENPPPGEEPKVVETFTKTPHGEVLTVSIPDQKVLADTGGMPLPGLAIVGLSLMAAGASLLRVGGWR